ncbi:oxygenase MpaB family protein [Mycobacterium sp.]|uniref:oxygenase MpaB family protein n=1 Tax=Mycobacterium sp. TaxID=1785 RepID=UPI002C2389B3|nr:oxygenase MpaB family protein [Mycobacterium sp.]HTY30021.1 oxygenase MpaB family protein [Mycobacterium sp.]
MSGTNTSSRWTDALLDRMRHTGDDLADKPVRAVLESHGVDAVNAIMRTLVRNDQLVPDDLPEEIRAYLAETHPLPEWADMGKIKRGQQLYETWGVLITLCLFCASLPASYAAADGVKVLYLTARLDTDARRRVMETGQFLMDVLSVGGLDEHGKGRRTIQRVRLMHAAVRQLIEARNEQAARTKQPPLWHPDWGTPINQEDLAGTKLVFSYIVADSLPRLGVRLPAKDVDAYLHLWNVIGQLMGIDDELRVDGIDDAKALVDAIRRRQFRASPEGQDMTKALLDLMDEMTPFHRFDDTIPPLIRHLIGDDVADMLDVPKSALPEIGRLARANKWIFVHVFGRTERDSPRYELVSRMARPFGYDLVHGLFRLERGGERAPFAMPDHLARSWELSG